MALIDVLQILWSAIRILAAVAGAFVGWLTTGFLVRLLFRLAFHRPTVRPILTLARLAIAVLVGFLIYWYFPSGSGGWGFGGGGLGPGEGGSGMGGTGTGPTAPAVTGKKATMKTAEPAVAADTLTIEVLGGLRYKGEGRYYLVLGKEPARNLQEVTEFLQKCKGRYRKLEILITPESVTSYRREEILDPLEAVAKRVGLTTSQTKRERTIEP